MTNVEVKQRTSEQTDSYQMTYLHPDLKKAFAGMGKHLRFGSLNDDQQGRDQQLGFEPVVLDEMPPAVQATIKRFRFKIRDGVVTRGDMVLQYRSLEDREIQHRREAEARQRLEGPEYQIEGLEAQLGDMARAAGGKLNRVVVDQGVAPVRESILGGVEALKQGAMAPEVRAIAEELLRRREAQT